MVSVLQDTRRVSRRRLVNAEVSFQQGRDAILTTSETVGEVQSQESKTQAFVEYSGNRGREPSMHEKLSYVSARSAGLHDIEWDPQSWSTSKCRLEFNRRLSV